MKATELLKQQHRKVETTLDRLESSKDDPTHSLKELAADLAAHMAIEQQVFYPTVRQAKPDLVDESYEEHALAELALKRLLRTPATNRAFRARVTVLKELIAHHVKEEEEELFPAAERALGAAPLEKLGARLERLFAETRSQGFEALVPSGFAQTAADEFERVVQRDRQTTDD